MKRLIFTIVAFCLLAGPAWAMDVALTWDANTEADLAGYNLYYSDDPAIPESNRMKIAIPLGMQGFNPANPEYTINGLPNEKKWYIAATAYDNEFPSFESGYSNIVSVDYAEVFTGKPPAVPGTLQKKTVVETSTITTTTTKVAYFQTEPAWQWPWQR